MTRNTAILSSGKKRKVDLRHVDIERWRTEVSSDRDALQRLLNETEAVTPERDEKLASLREKIVCKLNQPTANEGGENRKVLVFTAFADTATYLYENLKKAVQDEGAQIALIRGDGQNKTTSGKNNYDEILTNFSPISKARPSSHQDKQIDVLIATDCISEGQNLQDCDLLINYDIHWNPVRIIQRFGRIDRIGSRNKKVYLINFWPVKDLEAYLNLQHRVEARMVLADLSSTQTDNVLAAEIKEQIDRDLQFRNEQLKRIKDEVLDLEDLDDNIALSDFSLDEFRSDLLQFLEKHRQELEAANPGLYAVVPPAEDNRSAQPGVIFCLRHQGQSGATDAKGINPLGCHYLIYVLDDGTVRFTFTQPKQTLNLLRSVAQGHTDALTALCRQFDERTRDGTDMEFYSTLVKKALKSIKHTFDERNRSNLFSGRDGRLADTGRLPSESEEEYELLTWVVILAP